MQLRAEQLHSHLAKSLAPVYAVHGNEPLLALEAADAVRAAARRQGFSERAVFEPGRGFDWSEFTHAAASLSLFAEKKLVELRLAAGKPGLQGAVAIATAPCKPGFPAARRSSTSFFSANSDRLAAACVNSLQSKPRPGSNTARSEKPCLRAAARTASAASRASSGSSPWTA